MRTLLPLSLLVRPDRADPQPLVLYHGRSCPDGFAAVLAAWRFFEGQAEFKGLDHGDVRSIEDLPPLDGRAIYVLDFAFEPMLMQAIAERAAKLVVLDHHQSAATKLAGFTCDCGVVHFDMNKSGARLAWEFFFPEHDIPALARYVEDRDIWKWEFPESPAFLAALDMEPFDFERWNAIASFDAAELQAFMARGAAMDEKFRKLAADLAEGAQAVVFNGHSGLMLNVPGVFHSQIGDLLAQRSGTFALMWHASAKGIKVGLRSRSDFNCIPLAESMGGGGHPQACGFRMGLDQLGQLLSGELQAEPAALVDSHHPAG